MTAASPDSDTGQSPGGTRGEQANPDDIRAFYQSHAEPLKRFLMGLLGDESAAADALQSTFALLIEKGQDVPPSSWRSWTYKVAYHEAMQQLRRRKTESRIHNQVAWVGKQQQDPSTLARTIQREDVERVAEAIRSLPEELAEVVRLRIHQNLKFREISDRLDLPLGTVMSRMRAALKKLKLTLGQES